MTPDEVIQDGDQLKRIENELGPIHRLLARKKLDLFRDWSNDKEGKFSKDFCAGALSVIEALPQDIMDLIALAHELRVQRDEEEAQQEELAQTLRSPALEGGGHGDLAG